MFYDDYEDVFDDDYSPAEMNKADVEALCQKLKPEYASELKKTLADMFCERTERRRPNESLKDWAKRRFYDPNTEVENG